jgi:hypothetical protein
VDDRLNRAMYWLGWALGGLSGWIVHPAAPVVVGVTMAGWQVLQARRHA